MSSVKRSRSELESYTPEKASRVRGLSEEDCLRTPELCNQGPDASMLVSATKVPSTAIKTRVTTTVSDLSRPWNMRHATRAEIKSCGGSTVGQTEGEDGRYAAMQVVHVKVGAVAEQAGLRPGDFVVGTDGVQSAFAIDASRQERNEQAEGMLFQRLTEIGAGVLCGVATCETGTVDGISSIVIYRPSEAAGSSQWLHLSFHLGIVGQGGMARGVALAPAATTLKCFPEQLYHGEEDEGKEGQRKEEGKYENEASEYKDGTDYSLDLRALSSDSYDSCDSYDNDSDVGGDGGNSSILTVIESTCTPMHVDESLGERETFDEGATQTSPTGRSAWCPPPPRDSWVLSQQFHPASSDYPSGFLRNSWAEACGWLENTAHGSHGTDNDFLTYASLLLRAADEERPEVPRSELDDMGEQKDDERAEFITADVSVPACVSSGRMNLDYLPNIITPSLRAFMSAEQDLIRDQQVALVRLPVSPTVDELVHEFGESLSSTHGASNFGMGVSSGHDAEPDTQRAVMLCNLLGIFNHAIEGRLLYPQEQGQMALVKLSGKLPSQQYGAGHLLRLVAELPAIYREAYTTDFAVWLPADLQLLTRLIQGLVGFIEHQASRLFPSDGYGHAAVVLEEMRLRATVIDAMYYTV